MYLAVERPEVELATSRVVSQCLNLTTTARRPDSHLPNMVINVTTLYVEPGYSTGMGRANHLGMYLATQDNSAVDGRQD